MVSFDKMKDVHGWLANREAFEIRAIRLKVSPSGRLFGLEYEIPEEGLLVSDSRIVDGVDEGYFYLVARAVKRADGPRAGSFNRNIFRVSVLVFSTRLNSGFFGSDRASSRPDQASPRLIGCQKIFFFLVFY